MMTTTRTAAGLAALALTFGLPAASASAQRPIADLTTLRGTVVDAASESPLPAAAITIGGLERRAFTDRDGHFSLVDVEPGTHTVMVTQIGYDTLIAQVAVDPASEAVTFRLQPDPVVLERITAMVDRLQERRNSSGSSVRVFDQERLRNSAAFDALEFLRMRTGLFPTPCPNSMTMSSCAYVRGRPTPIRVTVDGTPVLAGVEMLSSYRPDELYALEVVSGGRQIHVYTNWFMETVAQGRRLPPVFYF